MEVLDIERRLSALRAAVQAEPGASNTIAPEFRHMIDALESLLTEVKLDYPSIVTMGSLYNEVLSTWHSISEAVEADFRSGDLDRSIRLSGSIVDARKIIEELSAQIVEIANRRAISIREATERHQPIPVDTHAPEGEDSTMTTPTREEIDAKLNAVEARIETRMASIENKIDRLVDSMDGRMQRIEQDIGSTNQYVRTLKHTIFGTAIAVALGVAGLNYTLLSNMVTAFESGKATATSQAEVKRQTEETAALLKQIQQQVNSAPQAPAPAQPAAK